MRLSPRLAVSLVPLLCFAAALVSLPSPATGRGIPLTLGDTVTSAVDPAGDADTFAFEGMAGGQLNLTLSPVKGSELLPDLEILDPTGAALDLAPFSKAKNGKTTVKKLELPETGAYSLRITGDGGTTGGYQLKTKGKPPKGLKDTLTLSPEAEHEFLFPAEPDSQVKVAIKAKGGTFEVLSVFDPDGEEIVGGVASFVTKKSSTKAVLYPSGSFGDYGFRVGNADADVALKVSIKVKHAKVKGQKREVSPLEPAITGLDPDIGRLDTQVTITGENFQTGAQVWFGDTPAKSATVTNDTTISAVSPNGDGVVDVTVVNPDGQDATLPGSYTYISLPPQITTVTPQEGPDSGGTVVDVFGGRLLFVEKVTLGTTDLVAAPTILAPDHLRFTTEAHAPGTFAITLTDEFDQTQTMFAAFTFFGVPRIDAVSPTGGSQHGGTLVAIHGDHFRADDEVFLDGSAVTPVTFVDPTELRITTPSHAVGMADIMVRDPWGRSGTLADAFEYRELSVDDATASKMPANGDGVVYGGTRIAAGDIDGDDDPDLVLGRPTGESPNTLLLGNDGKGTFSGGPSLPSPPNTNDLWESDGLAAGDLDGDGDLDLVVTTEQKTYGGTFKYPVGKYTYIYYTPPYCSTRVLLNDGSGTFSVSKGAMPDPRKTTTDLMQANAASLGDLDGDGDLDLVLTRSTAAESSTRYILGNGRGVYYLRFTVAKDSKISATRVLLNNGSGKFTNATNGSMPPVSNGDLFAGDEVLIGHVDTDDDLDLVLTGDGDELRDSKAPEYVKGSKTRLLLNSGKAAFLNATSGLMPTTKNGDDWGGVALALGDVDGDDAVDLVVGTNRGLYDDVGKTWLPSTRLFHNAGVYDGFVESSADALPSVRSDGQGDLLKATGLTLADTGGDVPDLVLTDTSPVYGEDLDSGEFDRQVSSTRLLRNDGEGVFTNETESLFPNPEQTGDYYLGHAVWFGDVDGDGDGDLVVTTTLVSYQGDGKRPTRLLLSE